MPDNCALGARFLPLVNRKISNAKSKATRKASSRGLLHTIQDKEGKEVIPGQPDAFWGTRQIKFISSYTLIYFSKSSWRNWLQESDSAKRWINTVEGTANMGLDDEFGSGKAGGSHSVGLRLGVLLGHREQRENFFSCGLWNHLIQWEDFRTSNDHPGSQLNPFSALFLLGVEIFRNLVLALTHVFCTSTSSTCTRYLVPKRLSNSSTPTCHY